MTSSRPKRDALTARDYAQARALVDGVAGLEAMSTLHGRGCNVTVVKEAMGLPGWPVCRVRPSGAPEPGASERRKLADILHDWDLIPAARA
jgi:4-hydroxy-tetrahydrodipicolinate synthase